MLLVLLAASTAQAQDVRDAETLPAKAGGLIISPAISGGTDRFGPNWHFFTRESILTDFADIDLTQIVASDAAGEITNTLGGPLGITNFTASQQSVGFNFTLAYGVTDRLTVAAVLPFASVTYNLEAWLSRPLWDHDMDPSTPQQERALAHYRVKDPQAIQCPTGDLQLNDPADFGRIVEEGGEGYEFNVDDLRKALTSACLGYKDPLDSATRESDGYFHGVGERKYSGFRDLILGAKYQWYHGEMLRFSTLTYVVVPTGSPDDPDDLFDPAFGDGQWDAALIAAVTVPLGKFRVSLATGYEVQFGDTIVRRLNGLNFGHLDRQGNLLPEPVDANGNDMIDREERPVSLEDDLAEGRITEEELYDQFLDKGNSLPIVPAYDKANVERKLGDNIYVYTAFGYELTEWLNLGMTVDFIHHFRDGISDTGTRVADNTRFKTSAELRAEVDAKIAAGEIPEEERTEALKGALASSAERKAAAYAWHTVRDQLNASLSIGFNTLPLFLRDEFPIPLIMSVSATMPVAGKNIDAIDSFGLSLVIPFVVGEVKDPAEYGYDDQEGQGLPWP